MTQNWSDFVEECSRDEQPVRWEDEPWQYTFQDAYDDLKAEPATRESLDYDLSDPYTQGRFQCFDGENQHNKPQYHSVNYNHPQRETFKAVILVLLVALIICVWYLM